MKKVLLISAAMFILSGCTDANNSGSLIEKLTNHIESQQESGTKLAKAGQENFEKCLSKGVSPKDCLLKSVPKTKDIGAIEKSNQVTIEICTKLNNLYEKEPFEITTKTAHLLGSSAGCPRNILGKPFFSRIIEVLKADSNK